MAIKAKFDVILGALREDDSGGKGGSGGSGTTGDDHYLYLRETSAQGRLCRISIDEGRIVVEIQANASQDETPSD